jgi:hypothetical protein
MRILAVQVKSGMNGLRREAPARRGRYRHGRTWFGHPPEDGGATLWQGTGGRTGTLAGPP